MSGLTFFAFAAGSTVFLVLEGSDDFFGFDGSEGFLDLDGSDEVFFGLEGSASSFDLGTLIGLAFKDLDLLVLGDGAAAACTAGVRCEVGVAMIVRGVIGAEDDVRLSLCVVRHHHRPKQLAK